MRRSIWTLSLALAALLGAGLAHGAGFTVEIKGSRRLPLAGVAANVFVANPAVADVVMVDPRSVIVLGKGYGVTEILVTDHSGRTLMDRRVAVVGSNAGLVTVYRGRMAQDYHCSSRCETINGAAPPPDSASNGGNAEPVASPAGDDTPLNVGPPVTVTQVGGPHP
ncbi:MAG TPA: pilus assembly protein N-terminal domain-containing protein [Caulobacteraceae bacterium]|nr:pilus assembly protein N-terminal domain-containing protein [Caulobacteraceae bacterium]